MAYHRLPISRNSDKTEEYRTREEGVPLVQYDLNHKTRIVTIDKWIQSILHVSLDQISDWSQRLSHEQLLRPTTSIMNNLRDYCEAPLETSRYASWATMVNKIISLAPELTCHSGQVIRSFITFTQNHPYQVEGGGAPHIPDVVIIPTSHFPPHPPSERTQIISGGELPSGVLWDQIVSCAEFTAVSPSKQALLKQIYEKLKAGYEMGPSREGLEEPLHSNVPSEINTLDQEMTSEQKSSTCGLKRRAVLSQSSPAKRVKVNSFESASPTARMCSNDAERMASYALELLSSTSGTRSHCIQFLIDGPELMLWYYDAAGIIRSEWMNWICDLPKFAAIIIAFSRIGIEQWGIGVPNLKPPLIQDPSSSLPLPKSLCGYTLMMDHKSLDGTYQPVQVTLQNDIYTEYNLTGRRTTVYDITTEPRICEKPLVLKMSMQPVGRLPETHFINHARKNEVGHLPEVHMWSDQDSEWRLSKGVRGELFPDNEGNEVYEDRCQRLIVFTKYKPIEDIISPANMHSLVLQIIDCIHELRYKAHILHRDISLGNVMYEQLVDGTIKIILNDFDCAIMVDDRGCSVAPNLLKHPTGTLPFMAHELLDPFLGELNPVIHYVRHDFESVFLVALWLIIKFSLRTKPTTEDEVKAQKAGRETLKLWACGSLRQIYSDKKLMFTTRDSIASLDDKFTMGHFKDWVTRFRRVFIKAYRVLDDAKEESASDSDLEGPREIADMETLDGLISRGRIHEVLRRWEKRKGGNIEGFVPHIRKATS